MKKIIVIVFILAGTFCRGFGQEKTMVKEMPTDPNKCFYPMSVNYAKKIYSLCYPFVQVSFVTQATYTARKGPAVKRGPKASISVKISNIGDEDFQAIVEELRTIAEKKFGDAGYTTIGDDVLKNTKSYQKMLQASDAPGVEQQIPALLKATGATHIKTFTSQGRPVYSAKTGGMNLYKLGKEINAGQAVIAYTIDFSTHDVETETHRSYKGGGKYILTESISVQALPALSVSGQIFLVKDGKSGGIGMAEPYGSPTNFVIESKKIDDTHYEWVVDKEAFKEAAIALLSQNIDLAVQYFKSIQK